MNSTSNRVVLSQWQRKGKKHAAKMQLAAVVTIAEAVAITGITRETMKQAIKDGRIYARQSGSTWLMRKADVIDRWGAKDTVAAVPLQGGGPVVADGGGEA